MSEGGAMYDTSVVNSRWSLLQISLVAAGTAGFHGVTSFPYYIHKHSGVFLVAYYLLVVLICIPVCYVQIKLGAIFQRGIVGIFSILVPILKGSAVSLLLLTYIRCLLHGVELSYALYFSFASMKYPFPWSRVLGDNGTEAVLKFHHRPADKYFHEDFLQKSDSIDEVGVLLWYIVLCLLATWVIIYFLTWRGTALFGKIVYVLTPASLIMLVVIMIYGYTSVPGASASVGRLLWSRGEPSDDQDNEKSLLDDVQHKLSSPRPWIDALQLHIYSLGLWSGLLPTLGALVYNRKYVVNASWILLLLVYNILPQIAMFALAPYIDPQDSGGFIAVSKGIQPGLPFLFIAIPSSFDKLQLSPVISFALFMCIFLLGLGHQSLHLLAIWENLLPSTPAFLMSYFKRRECLVGVACGVSFLLSVPYAVQGGIHLYAIINDYVDRLIFTLIIITTVPFLVGYIKQELLYIPIERAFMSIWYGLAALISTGLLLYYFAVYVYPEPVVGYDQRWAEDLGWFVAVAPVVTGLVLGAIHAVYTQKGSFRQRIAQSLRSETLSCDDSSPEYTSGGTGDTALQQTIQQSPSLEPMCKTETEVFVQPFEEGDPENV